MKNWWADSVECYTYLRNVTDLWSDGKTPYERRFWATIQRTYYSIWFIGWASPFNCEGSVTNPSIWKESFTWDCSSDMLCTRWEFGRVTYWSQNLRSWRRWTHLKSTRKGLNAKEVIFPPQEREFTFPIADGRIKTPGGNQELRTSTLIRPRPIQGEGHLDFLGESEGSFPQPDDSLPVAGEAMNNFWSMSGSFVYRHHVEPRVKLYSPREESFPIPLKYIDVARTTHTNVDVKLEKRIEWQLECRWVSRLVWSLDGFSHKLLCWKKNFPKDSCGLGRDWRGTNLHPGQIIVARIVEVNGKAREVWRRSKSGLRKKLHLENARKLRGNSFHRPQGYGIQGNHQERT